MPHIDVIEPENASGRLKDIYDDLIKKRGKLAEVHQLQSLNPESIVHHMELYMHLMFGKSPLKRYQREMLGVITSVTNKCHYCQIHHATALNHFWKDEQKTAHFVQDFNQVNLTPTDRMLCHYAQELTNNPGNISETTFNVPLKKSGLTDREILDATLIIAYFNFVNRIVLGLGGQVEDHLGKGFRYD